MRETQQSWQALTSLPHPWERSTLLAGRQRSRSSSIATVTRGELEAAKVHAATWDAATDQCDAAEVCTACITAGWAG
jgi:hypothetical protein